MVNHAVYEILQDYNNNKISEKSYTSDCQDHENIKIETDENTCMNYID